MLVLSITDDPALWPESQRLTNQQRNSIILKLANTNPEEADLTEIATKDKTGKPFPNYLQYAKEPNGCEKIKRGWLIYSKSEASLYCIPCLLFSHEQKQPSSSALNSKHSNWQT